MPSEKSFARAAEKAELNEYFKYAEDVDRICTKCGAKKLETGYSYKKITLCVECHHSYDPLMKDEKLVNAANKAKFVNLCAYREELESMSEFACTKCKRKISDCFYAHKKVLFCILCFEDFKVTKAFKKYKRNEESKKFFAKESTKKYLKERDIKSLVGKTACSKKDAEEAYHKHHGDILAAHEELVCKGNSSILNE